MRMQQVKALERSISCPMRRRRARKGSCKLTSRSASLALALLLQAFALGQVPEIDLTGPSPYPPSTRGVVPMGGGGLSGERVGPQPYDTPLQVHLIGEIGDSTLTMSYWLPWQEKPASLLKAFPTM